MYTKHISTNSDVNYNKGRNLMSHKQLQSTRVCVTTTSLTVVTDAIEVVAAALEAKKSSRIPAHVLTPLSVLYWEKGLSFFPSLQQHCNVVMHFPTQTNGSESIYYVGVDGGGGGGTILNVIAEPLL